MSAGTTRAGMLATLAVATLAVTATSCKQQVLCPPLSSCGAQRDGNNNPVPPVGDWVLAPGFPSCTEDLYVPANDTRLGLASTVPVGTPYPEPALFDWCLLLVTGPIPGPQNPGVQVKQPRFFYESGPIGVVTLNYTADGHFTAGITRTGTFTLDLPSYCVHAFGAVNNRPPDPSDPASQPADVCKQLELPIRASGLGEGSYRNTRCQAVPYSTDPPDQHGCECTFDVTETGGPTGSYQVMPDGQTIVHFPGSNFPQKATFCHEGDRLQLTGSDLSYLFDQRGVRTFDLARSCGSDRPCTSRHCDLKAPVHICTPCTANDQCLTKTCDTATGACARCTDSAVCGDRYCDLTSGTCEACTDNAQCGARFCDKLAGLCKPPCTDNAQCASNMCDLTTGMCL